MESAPEPLRIKLVLGKFRVVKVDRDALGVKIVLDLGNSVKATTQGPPYLDVNEGDILTLYTEVFSHATPEQSSVQ